MISGHAMLLSRLFHTENPNAAPPVVTKMTTDNLTGNGYSFLRMEDRKLLERAYEYASANGMDLEQVDAMAFDLSHYRFLEANGTTTEQTGIAGLYDAEGNPWVGRFNKQDSELAKRMLTNPVINETSLDKGFLAFILNPQRTSVHAVSFESLEKFISVLSPSGGKSFSKGAEGQPSTPSDAGLAQALYRIDHPYVGEKWVPKQAQNSDSEPLQHLSKSDRTQLMATYLHVLIRGGIADRKALEQMSVLIGISRMQQDGSLNNSPLSPQDATEKVGQLLQLLTTRSKSVNQEAIHNLLPIRTHCIDTSA